MAEPLRPLSIGQLLDRAVQFYRNNVLLFVGIAVPTLLLLVTNQVMALVFHNTISVPKPGQFPTFHFGNMWLELLVSLLIGIVVGAYVAGATTWAVWHLELGEPASIRGSYREIHGQVASVVGANLLVALCICVPIFAGFAAYLLAVPISPIVAALSSLITLAGVVLAIWILLRLIVVVPAVVLERPGVMAALRRSAALTKGFVGSVLLVLLAAICLYFAVTLVFSVAGEIAYATAHSFRAFQVTAFIGNCIGALIATPLITIAFTLLYFDFKVRKEGFDLELLLRRSQDASGADAASL